MGCRVADLLTGAVGEIIQRIKRQLGGLFAHLHKSSLEALALSDSCLSRTLPIDELLSDPGQLTYECHARGCRCNPVGAWDVNSVSRRRSQLLQTAVALVFPEGIQDCLTHLMHDRRIDQVIVR